MSRLPASTHRHIVEVLVTTNALGQFDTAHRFRYLAAFMRVIIATTLVVASLLSAAAAADARVYVADCNNIGYLKFRPGAWSNGCTGGATNIRGLKWSRYRQSGASASGRAWLRLPCGDQPCSEVGVYKTSARLRFSRVRTCHLGEAKLGYFSRVRVSIRYGAGNPYGRKPGWERFTSNVPTAGDCNLTV